MQIFHFLPMKFYLSSLYPYIHVRLIKSTINIIIIDWKKVKFVQQEAISKQ